MASIGDTFRTCNEAPESGVYEFVRHVDPSVTCTPTAEEREIPLSSGEHFPPCRSCESAAIWRLKRKA